VEGRWGRSYRNKFEWAQSQHTAELDGTDRHAAQPLSPASVAGRHSHSFRRAFALNMLRAGVDIFSLQKLMGHADLQIPRRYLAQTTEDIQLEHRAGSPVDNM